MTERGVNITGIGLVSALGTNTETHVESTAPAFRPLAEHPAEIDPSFDAIPAAWIAERDFLNSRKLGPATCLAIEVARQAVADAGLERTDLRDAHLWVGTSRGNAAAFIDPWPGRRSTRLLAASNSLHGEIAAAVSIELGIHGPYNVLANGCSASLDAIGWAFESIRSGRTRTAIAVGVELPISPSLMRDYRNAGMLTDNGISDPYSPQASGFIPAEAGAALVLQASESKLKADFSITKYLANSDASSLLSVPKDGAPLARLIKQIETPPELICPHASGTPIHAIGEIAGLRRAFPSPPPLLPLKALLGHAIGGSGAFELAYLTCQLRHSKLPTTPNQYIPDGFNRELHKLPTRLLKIASSMGGHNALVELRLKPSTE